MQTTISEIAAFKIEASEIIASIDEDVNLDSYQNCIIRAHQGVRKKEWEQALEDARMKYRKAQKAEHQIRRS